jgi:hypothetical protein
VHPAKAIAMSTRKKEQDPHHQPPGTSGYPEPQPTPSKGKSMPDEHTPHEPQNNPRQKPKSS